MLLQLLVSASLLEPPRSAVLGDTDEQLEKNSSSQEGMFHNYHDMMLLRHTTSYLTFLGATLIHV